MARNVGGGRWEARRGGRCYFLLEVSELAEALVPSGFRHACSRALHLALRGAHTTAPSYGGRMSGRVVLPLSSNGCIAS